MRQSENRKQGSDPRAITPGQTVPPDKIERMQEDQEEFSELDYTLMKENIEKMKRIRILKQVKSVFSDMFTRVHDLTDNLQIQLDQAMKEHRKVNRMFNQLQRHITGVQTRLQIQDDQTALFDENDMELQRVRDRPTPSKSLLPKIESADSNRHCSLPDIFKVEGSSHSPVREWLSTSKACNIKTIAVKKSKEQSLVKGKERKKSVTEEEYGTGSSSLKVNSADFKPSKELTNGRSRKKHKRQSFTEQAPSKSGVKDNYLHTHKVVRGTSVDESSKKVPKDFTGNNVINNEIPTRPSAPRRRPDSMQPRLFEITATHSKGEEISTVTRHENDCPVSKNPADRREGSSKALSKLKVEQIVEKIKSIENCIIQPEKLRKHGENSSIDQDLLYHKDQRTKRYKQN